MLKKEFLYIIELSGIDLSKLNMFFEVKTFHLNSISCWQEDNNWYLQQIDNENKITLICDKEESIINEFYDCFKNKLNDFNVEENYCLASLEDLILLNKAKYPNPNLINAWHYFSQDDICLFFEFKRYILTGEFDLKVLNLLINKCIQLIEVSDKENIKLKNRYANLSKIVTQLEEQLTNQDSITEELLEKLKKQFLDNKKDL